MKRRETMTILILDLLLLVPGLLGSIDCLITAFSLPESMELWAIALSAVTLFSISLGHQKRDRLTAPLLLLALAIPAYLFRVELYESFRNLWGVLSTSYAKGYDFFRDYVPKGSTNKETVGTALAALTVLEAYLCCLSVRVWKRTTPGALALLICVIPCFVLTDTPPDLAPLMIVVFTILTQAFSQSVRRRAAGEQVKAVLVAGLLSAAALFLLVKIFPQKNYEPPLTWEQLSEKVDQWKKKQNNWGNISAGLTGNPGDVDLSGLSALPNRAYAVFYVTSTQDAHLYLCGSSYVDFDGLAWNRVTGEYWSQEVLFPYSGRDGGATLTIETLESEPLLYTTYHVTQMQEGMPVSDAYLQNNTSTKQYTMEYLAQTDPLEPDLRYDAWIRRHCLGLPERTRDGVLAWWSQCSAAQIPVPDTSDTEALLEFAQTVAEEVSHCAQYSRTPVQMPEDADFCTWFLNEAESGYCVHFASSCVALLRSLGIPSRYMSGYVCDAIANNRSRVTNLQAHAWAEVWIGGRWIPVEPTPPEATEFTGQIGPSDTRSTEEFYDPAERQTSPRPSETWEFEPITEATVPSEASSQQNPDPNGTVPKDQEADPDSSRSFDLGKLGICLGILCVPILLVGRRRLKRRLWDKRYFRAQPNEKARLLYRRMLRLQKAGGGDVPQTALALAKKASFSQHTLSDHEVEALRQLCQKQIKHLSKANFFKRMYCRYVLAIL